MNGRVEISGINTEQLKKISAREGTELLKRIKSGDKEAKELFIIANMRLVLSIIKKFRETKVPSDDLFQAGRIGLIKATDNFDLSVGVRFSTYTVPMILGELKRFLRARNSLRVARSIRDTAYMVIKTRGEIEKADEEATVCEIASRLKIAEREVVYALDAISDPVSLYDPVYVKGGDSLMLMDQIADEKNTDENWAERVSLDSAMGELNQREKKILYLRYYEGKTQTEISAEVGLSQAQVSRIEKTALKTLKTRIS